jgi:hypothetical protein
MPRAITHCNELTDESAAMGQTNCPMCGAIQADNLTDRAEHSDTEIIRKLAAFMADDWKACCILLLYVAMPNETIRCISRHIILSDAAICEARQRAAERFPDLAGLLGLRTPRARARQAFFAAKQQQEIQGELL